MRTREQVYAAAVFEKVSAFHKAHNEAAHKKYGSMAHKLPVLIRTAGLAQALAFLEARGYEHQKQLLIDLQAVLGQPKLVASSREAQLGEYARLTREALAALLWFKRFAQSVLKVQASDEPGDDNGKPV